MKKSAVAFIVPLLLAASSAFAAEMFEAYPKKVSLGYVSNAVNFRYWFTPAWGLDTSVGFADHTTRSTTDDGVIKADDRENGDRYSLSLAAVRTIRNFDYFDLNLKAGVSYSHDRGHADPDGPNNELDQLSKTYSLYAGPEIEIKLPYFSRLVIVSSIQAAYSVEVERVKEEQVFGTVKSNDKASSFTLTSDGNSLDELFHIGVRYYF